MSHPQCKDSSQDEGPPTPTLPSKIRERSDSPIPGLAIGEIASPAHKRQKKRHFNITVKPLDSEQLPIPLLAKVKSEPVSPPPTKSVPEEESSSDDESGASSSTEENPVNSKEVGATDPHKELTNSVKEFFNVGIPSHPNLEEIFCYKCKNYGHLREDCRNRWYRWWPDEYLSKYFWLRRRIHEAIAFRNNGRMREFHWAMQRIEDDVQAADQKMKVMNVHQRYHAYREPVPRNDGQRILRAMRRITPSPSVSPPPKRNGLVLDEESKHFKFEKKIEDLQSQVEQLRLELYHCKRSNNQQPNQPSTGWRFNSKK